jgi:hypothetical protein
MLKKLMFFIWLLPLAAAGQYHITGRVIDKDTKKPVAFASIILNNTMVGAQTGDDGSFTLNNVRSGQYDMLISFIGYTTYHQTIMVNGNMELQNVEITAQSIALKEVRIGIDKHWAEHYAIFKREFIGWSDNASRCDILNPHAVDFDYDRETGELTAFASVPLIIINKALGYKITYTLDTFTINNRIGTLYFAGSSYFENLSDKPRQLKRWKSERLDAYLGSSMHFLRSAIINKVTEEGFTVKRLIRIPNPDYKGGFGAKYKQTLVDTLLYLGDYYHNTDQKGEYALQLDNCLYIKYKDGPLQATILTFNAPYAFFDNNGIVMNPRDLTLEGGWAGNRIAELLPQDYDPGEN